MLNNLFTYIIILFLSSNIMLGQKINEGVLSINDTQIKFKDLKIDEGKVTYLNANNIQQVNDLTNITGIKEKKGTHILSGLLGGLGGSVLGTAIANSGREGAEWWYGIGSTVLIGSSVGAVIGALIPRYKAVEISPSSKIEVSLNSISLSF